MYVGKVDMFTGVTDACRAIELAFTELEGLNTELEKEIEKLQESLSKEQDINLDLEMQLAVLRKLEF